MPATTDTPHPADGLNQALNTAHAWAQRGIPAFPAAISWDPTKYDGAGGLDKRPLTEHGHLDATLDPDELTHLYTAASLRPGEVFGTALHPGGGHLVIFDIDRKGDKNGFLAADQLGLRDTWGSSTPSGGEHRWFRRPDHTRIGNQSPWAQDGIDIRGDDGWIIAPGTITPWGNWAKLDQDWEDGAHLHAVPDFILGRLRHRPATTTPSSTGPSSWQQLRAEHRAELHPATNHALDQLIATGGHSPIIKREAGRDPWVELTRPGKRYGTSATCGRIAPGVVKVWTPNWDGLPEGIYETTPDGLRNAAQHEQALWDEWDATSSPTAAQEPTAGPDGLGAYRVDWHELWTQPTAPEWLIEPVIAAGRGHALYAPAKAGKSLFITWVAAQAAQGLPVLDQPAGPPVPTLYCDLEMTRDDLRERLEAMGHGPHSNLEHLHWLSLPPLILDTAAGARALTDYATEVGAQLVIVDTTARAVEGDENLADTYRSFARHTGISLKRAGIAFLRTDHAGKDLDKGQRGSSAKNDDVDIVWQLARKDQGALTIKATHRRMGWVPDELELTQTDDPALAYARAGTRTWAAGTDRLVRYLDEIGAPLDISQRAATELVKAENGGPGANQAALRDALKFRRTNTTRAVDNWVNGSGRADTSNSAARPGTRRARDSRDPARDSDNAQVTGPEGRATKSATQTPAERDPSSPPLKGELGREPRPCRTCQTLEHPQYLDADGDCADCQPF